MVGIFDPACELLPPWTKELYFVLLSLYLLSDLPLPSPPPKLNVQYIQTMCGCEGGVGVVELCCRPYFAVLHSVSDQIQKIQNCFTTPNKMTNKDDIKGLVSLKFLRPWCIGSLRQLAVPHQWQTACRACPSDGWGNGTTVGHHDRSPGYLDQANTPLPEEGGGGYRASVHFEQYM
jgi:hypothetical protein